MIVIANDRTKYPPIEGAVYSDILESITGSDILVSPADLPATKPALIREHLEDCGALLLQVKIGLDLASSVGTRLNLSLAKMKEVAPRQCQRVLLFVGTLACDENGRAIIDGRKVDEAVPGVNWAACQTALEAWCERGGVTYQLSRSGLLVHWLKAKEKRLKEYADNPRALIYPEKPELNEAQSDDPLQILVRVNDYRVSLSYLIGPKKTQAIHDAVHGHGGLAFKYLSDLRLKDLLPKGVYESDQRKFRQRLCLADDEIIEVRKLTTDDY